MLVSDISLMSSISCIFYHCHHYGYIIRSLSLHYVPYTTYKKNTKNMQVLPQKNIYHGWLKVKKRDIDNGYYSHLAIKKYIKNLKYTVDKRHDWSVKKKT